ncbi:Na(+)/H(+) antiporter subunit D [Novipirellula galeiformis]|uniref:Na(+)/H(+) antiporter subunit D n=1 Tax=Novipirellula galeiformis TaxID=2528004 RepID=A0A5C6CE23_9BACT|nr:proton-conducting transporter membrane subunit [Novipirellula galeiformis]TWU22518.1 Na(+)/H(+) antiporter subunit D [Novipirellula galeiformis]
MTPELAMVGLITLPLAAGIIAFVVRRVAVVLTIVVASVQIVLAGHLAHSVFYQGRLRYEVGGWGAPLGIDLYVDGLSALMLLMTALVGLAIVVYSPSYFAHPRSHHSGEYFWPLCLFLFASLNALFLAGDLFNLYVTLELLTLTAVALIGLAGTVDALAAALRYLIVAVTASLFFLLGVALLYSSYGTVDLHLLATKFQFDLPSRCSIVLIAVGLLLKTALFPLHYWLPPAHAAAPSPASALLSGLVLKSSFYVLLRLWFDVFPYADLRLVGHLLGVLGATAILWGSIQAIRQTHLKLLVAYSTVAQIGYLFLVFSLTVETTMAWSGAVLFAASHSLAKAAAFLAAGSLKYAHDSDRIDELAGAAQRQPVTIFAFAIAGVGLMGLPPSGGFLAKWMLLNSAVTSGRWGYALVMLSGGVLAAIYVFRVVAKSFENIDPIASCPVATRPISPWMQWTPLALAVASLALGVLAYLPLGLLEIGAPFSPTSGGGTP